MSYLFSGGYSSLADAQFEDASKFKIDNELIRDNKPTIIRKGEIIYTMSIFRKHPCITFFKLAGPYAGDLVGTIGGKKAHMRGYYCGQQNQTIDDFEENGISFVKALSLK